jgi:hypothetical protein
MTEFDFLDFEESETVKALNLDTHLVVIVMSLCIAYFSLFLFNKMLILSN